VAVDTTRPIEHPGRNLKKALSLRTVQRTAEERAIGLLYDRVNPDILPKPGMMRVHNFALDGLLGVLKPCCTIERDRIPRWAT
jgi:hypothetical protein